jgi:hypothetical protein
MPARKKTKKWANYQEYLQSPEWKKIREEVVARDGERCLICSADGTDKENGLEVHHWRYADDWANDNADNCVTLCADCHRDRHLGKGAATIDEALDQFRCVGEFQHNHCAGECRQVGYTEGIRVGMNNVFSLISGLATGRRPEVTISLLPVKEPRIEDVIAFAYALDTISNLWVVRPEKDADNA